MSAMPEWTKSLIPVDMDGAAAMLGISRRFLIETLKDHPHFERRGAKKVFYQEHIMQLREAMSCQVSPSKNAMEYGTSLALSEESAFEEALKLATAKLPKNSRRNTKRGSGNVVPMGKRQ